MLLLPNANSKYPRKYVSPIPFKDFCYLALWSEGLKEARDYSDSEVYLKGVDRALLSVLTRNVEMRFF
jgi:hypothetical protein